MMAKRGRVDKGRERGGERERERERERGARHGDKIELKTKF